MPYVKSSAWYAHSELVLQTMVSSTDQAERLFGVRKILELRGTNQMGSDHHEKKRHQHESQLNVAANSLEELISWNEAQEPVLTRGIQSEKLKEFITRHMDVTQFPVHGQWIERCVKEVTADPGQVFGYSRRDGFIRARMAHREGMPKFVTKKDVMRMANQ